MKTTPQHWWDYADEDLRSAELVLQGPNFRTAAYLCQQAVEKGLKAIILRTTGQTPPKIHLLGKLAELSGVTEHSEFRWFELLNILDRYYVDLKYPGLDENLLRTVTGPDAAHELLEQTRELYEWLKTLTL